MSKQRMQQQGVRNMAQNNRGDHELHAPKKPLDETPSSTQMGRKPGATLDQRQNKA